MTILPRLVRCVSAAAIRLGGHQPVDVLVMLVEHHAVEAELVRIGELVDVLLVKPAALGVPQRFGTVTQPVSYFSSKSAGKCG